MAHLDSLGPSCAGKRGHESHCPFVLTSNACLLDTLYSLDSHIKHQLQATELVKGMLSVSPCFHQRFHKNPKMDAVEAQQRIVQPPLYDAWHAGLPCCACACTQVNRAGMAAETTWLNLVPYQRAHSCMHTCCQRSDTCIHAVRGATHAHMLSEERRMHTCYQESDTCTHAFRGVTHAHMLSEE
eukprot:1161657-Pelagomonas_calceolata.AAC.2